MSTNTAVSGGNNLLDLATDINRFYSIHELICSKLNIVDIIALSRTCKQYSGLYSYLQKTKWNINTRLSDYFTDPRAFRAVQGTTETCIIGSFARDFFECNARARSAGSKRMLDLRVKVGKDGLALKEYLVTEGYIKDERPENNFYDVQVDIFHRENINDNTIDGISVLQTSATAIEFLFFQATLTHNAVIISWNKAYCLFPISSIVKRKTYILEAITESVWPLYHEDLRRCKEDGYKVKVLHWSHANALHDTSEESEALLQQRRVGDKHSWVMQLDTQDVKPMAPAPDFVLDYAGFSLGIFRSPNADNLIHGAHYKLLSSMFESPVLKYTYMRPSLDDCDETTTTRKLAWKGLQQHLDMLTVLELKRLEHAQRPEGYHRVIAQPGRANELLLEWEPPEDWTYYDEDMEEWLKKLEQQAEN